MATVSARPSRLPLTLADLITAIQGVVDPEAKGLVAATARHCLLSGQIAGLRIERGVHFANVKGNSSSQWELLTVNDDGVWVLGTIPSFSFYNATGGAFYGLR